MLRNRETIPPPERLRGNNAPPMRHRGDIASFPPPPKYATGWGSPSLRPWISVKEIITGEGGRPFIVAR